MLDDRILEALIAHHLAILGKTGMGKSYVGKLLVEYELRLQHRVVIIDPTGVYWGLKASADGKSAGFPIAVLGGDHADRPLLPSQGREIARILGATNLPTVLDVADMKVGEQQTFVSDFTDEIFSANRGALRLVIDEADAFAPQGSAPEQRKMFGHVDRIVRRGRSRGLYVTMISQRPAALHKNVLSQVDALVVLGVTAPQDRKALLAWVEGNTTVAGEAKAFTDSLPALKRGTGWAWAPKAEIMERVDWPAITTFDSGRTPKHGETIMPPQTLAEVDLSALDHIADAGKKVPEGTSLSNPVPSIVYRTDPHEIVEAEQRGHERGRRVGYSEGFAAARAFMVRAMADMDREQHIVEHQIDRPRTMPKPSSTVLLPPKARVTEIKTNQTLTVEVRADLPLPTGAQRMLDELERRYPMRMSWAQLAQLCKRKARGGQFNDARKRLRVSGRIVEGDDGLLQAVDGSKGAGAPTLADWCEILPAMPARMLRALAAAKNPIDREGLAGRIERAPTGGQFNDGLATLRRNALIIEEGGRISAAPELRGD